MPSTRYTESLLRHLIETNSKLSSQDPREAAQRFGQLWRNLEPESEFSLILSWLGNCVLVHKLGQEQLPHQSPNKYRVPDLLAVFNYHGRLLPVLIEVKTSAKPGRLSLNSGYLRYAEVMGLPMLVAWRHLSFWTLFEMRHATLARVNYNIDFHRAMEENLLCLLAGDFSYRIFPGSAISMRIEKLSEETADGGFEGMITDVHVTDPHGERIPEIPHLASLFLILDDEVEIMEDGRSATQRFVIRDRGCSELASMTLAKVALAQAQIHRGSLDWRDIFHNTEHWAQGQGQLHKIVDMAAVHGVAEKARRFRPKHMPTFL